MDDMNFADVLAMVVENKMMEIAQKDATEKLDRIIERQGDLDGARREAWYFEQLVQESMMQQTLRAVLTPIEIMKEESEECVQYVSHHNACLVAQMK